MKSLDKKINPDIEKIINKRRNRILLSIYIFTFLIFSIFIAKDLLLKNLDNIAIEIIPLVAIVISYLLFYKNKNLDIASYSITIIGGISTIYVASFNQYESLIFLYVIPFYIGSVFLFSLKKGIIINIIYTIFLFFTMFCTCTNQSTTNNIFLHDNMAIFNFVLVLAIIFSFTYFYEMSRVDAYKMLLNLTYKKDMLYNEIHHRIKNNLNLVTSMLSMQSAKSDLHVKKIIETSKERINSIAMVHSMLYVSDNIEKINSKEFIARLSNNLLNSANIPIKLKTNIKEMELPLNEIIPIGLILNELMTNSIKYAFESIKEPKITIVLHVHKEVVHLTYHDNGIGKKEDIQNSLGLTLVHINAKQLKGNLKIKQNHGLTYKITYKRDGNV